MATRPVNQQYELPPASPFANHGKTTASWTLVWLVIIGLAIGAVGMILETQWLIFGGIGVMAIGVVAGLVMRGMGLGQPTTGEAAENRKRDWYES